MSSMAALFTKELISVHSLFQGYDRLDTEGEEERDRPFSLEFVGRELLLLINLQNPPHPQEK